MKEFTIYHIMHRDTPVADVYLSSDHKTIRLKKLVPDGIKQPFSGDIFNLERFYRFLKDRCYEDGRADLKEILAQANMSTNNPWEWVIVSHGVTWEDYFWVKINDEQVTWKEVRVRE